RRHMALLLKWLHPDLFQSSGGNKGFNRSVYVNLVTNAWEAVKTAERRASYDASRAGSEQGYSPGIRPAGHYGNGVPPEAQAAGARVRHRMIKRRLAPYGFQHGSFWTWLLSHFGRHR